MGEIDFHANCLVCLLWVVFLYIFNVGIITQTASCHITVVIHLFSLNVSSVCILLFQHHRVIEELKQEREGFQEVLQAKDKELEVTKVFNGIENNLTVKADGYHFFLTFFYIFFYAIVTVFAAPSQTQKYVLTVICMFV